MIQITQQTESLNGIKKSMNKKKGKKELQYSLGDIFWLPRQDSDKVKNVIGVEVCAVVMYAIICSQTT